VTADSSPTILIVPGLREHVPGHWQTLLQERLEQRKVPVACVPRRAVDKLSCARWVEAIEQSLAAITGPVILAAHSGGVIMVAHWAGRSSRPIHGALLATPADVESPLPPGYPTCDALAENGWLPIPRRPLPFPSLVAASTNDPLGRYERIVELAGAWGSRIVDLGAVGHLNPAAGFGPWPRAEELLADLW
jgi:predicted alpha/beta hydrolase family esterase